MACDQSANRFLLLDPAADWNDESKLIGSWSPAQAGSGVRSQDVTWFDAVTDAKRIAGGTQALFSASGGAVAWVRVADRRALFYANAGGNVHSVEMLPDSNLVSASSTGNYLTLFNTGPGGGSVRVTFADAHGVVWDARRNRLWAIGGEALASFAYNGNRRSPGLTALESFPLPTRGGHDLFPLPGADLLLLSTGSGVYTFDPQGKRFQPFAPMSGIGDVKSVSRRDSGGPILYVTPSESWWTDTVRFVGGNTKMRRGARFYKARWWVDNPFSYGGIPTGISGGLAAASRTRSEKETRVMFSAGGILIAPRTGRFLSGKGVLSAIGARRRGS